jgi:hypothetical protein
MGRKIRGDPLNLERTASADALTMVIAFELANHSKQWSLLTLAPLLSSVCPPQLRPAEPTWRRTRKRPLLRPLRLAFEGTTLTTVTSRIGLLSRWQCLTRHRRNFETQPLSVFPWRRIVAPDMMPTRTTAATPRRSRRRCGTVQTSDSESKQGS